MYVCYLCGKEHSSKAIAIHEKKCLVKQMKKNNKKIARRPPLENANSLQERNAIARRAYETSLQVKCSGCHRTFLGEDKLSQHQTECDEYIKKEKRQRLRLRQRDSNSIIQTLDNTTTDTASPSNVSIIRPLVSSLSTTCIETNSKLQILEDNDTDTVTTGTGAATLPSVSIIRPLGSSLSMTCNETDDNTSMNRMHVCYLCGRDYGSGSIARHEKTCLEIKLKQQENNLMSKIPPRPPFEKATTLKERNDMARCAYELTAMEQCPGCKRTFHSQEKLSKHMKGCNDAKRVLRKSFGGFRDCMGGENRNNNSNWNNNVSRQLITKNSGNQKKKNSLQMKKRQQGRLPLGISSSILPIIENIKSSEQIQLLPSTLTMKQHERDNTKNNNSKMHLCYICGREYGSNSIAIHEKLCYDLKLKQHQQQGKKLLIRPPMLEKADTLEERNSIAQEAYETMMTVQCFACYRTFSSKDKVAKHMKGCERAKRMSITGIRDCLVSGSNNNDVETMMNNISNKNDFCQIITPSKTTIDQHLNNTSTLEKSRRCSSRSSFTSTTMTMSSSSSSMPPNIYLCYICGRQYGSNSVASHEQKCLDLHRKQQELLPKGEQKEIILPPYLPPPGNPTTRDLRNDLITDFQEMKVMEKCFGCHRTFASKEKLQKHTKGCKAAVEAMARKNKAPLLRNCIVPTGSESERLILKRDTSQISNMSGRSVTSSGSSNNKMYMCYICGREYGSKSIAIHERQCRVLFQKQQDRLPKEEQNPIPQRPDFDKSSSLIQRNAMAKLTYKSSVMETCCGCNRTFHGKDKLIKHQKGCFLFKEQLLKPLSLKKNVSQSMISISEVEFAAGFIKNDRNRKFGQSCRF